MQCFIFIPAAFHSQIPTSSTFEMDKVEQCFTASPDVAASPDVTARFIIAS